MDDIADMIHLENGGQPTDWNCYPFEYYKLFCYWKAAEKDVENIRSRRMQIFLRSWMEQK